jgi:hypothetical protein
MRSKRLDSSTTTSQTIGPTGEGSSRFFAIAVRVHLHNLYHEFQSHLLCVQSSLIIVFITTLRMYESLVIIVTGHTIHVHVHAHAHAHFLPLPLPLARPRPLNPLLATGRLAAFFGCGPPPPPSSPSLQ